MMKIKNITKVLLLLSIFLVGSCGYKLGGLEVIGENVGKTASIKILKQTQK